MCLGKRGMSLGNWQAHKTHPGKTKTNWHFWGGILSIMPSFPMSGHWTLLYILSAYDAVISPVKPSCTDISFLLLLIGSNKWDSIPIFLSDKSKTSSTLTVVREKKIYKRWKQDIHCIISVITIIWNPSYKNIFVLFSMPENHWSLNTALSPNSLPYWNCLHAKLHTSFITE